MHPQDWIYEIAPIERVLATPDPCEHTVPPPFPELPRRYVPFDDVARRNDGYRHARAPWDC